MFEMRPYRRNSMSTWNPFSEMEEMERRLFNNDFFSGRGLAEFKTDITDEGDYYELKADLPGFKKEDIQLQLDGDTLTIQAQRHSEHEEQEKKGKYGHFSLRFSTSRTNGPRLLLQAKVGTHPTFGEKSHTSAYTPKRVCP